MPGRIYNVLFACTGNSARSIMAEALMNRIGSGRFRAFSAGSKPAGKVNQYAIQALESAGFPTIGLNSKSWHQFAEGGAPRLDFVITLCDNAAGEACPIWIGSPVTAHWGLPDPAAVQGTESERLASFNETVSALRRRIEVFADLPLDKLDARALQSRLNDLGKQHSTA
jgi:protein-tyrosine-phosphatase